MKRFLFVLRQAPHVSVRVQEVLDQILTTGAFDQDAAILFLDDGVLQICGGQVTDNRELKDTAATLKALNLYGIDRAYVEFESLTERGLKRGDLAIGVEVVARSDVGLLMQGFDVLIPD